MKTKPVILTALGNIIIGLGIAILNISGFGINAFTSLTTGVSNLLGIGALINLFLLGASFSISASFSHPSDLQPPRYLPASSSVSFCLLQEY